MRLSTCAAVLVLLGLPAAAQAAQPARCDFDGDGTTDLVTVRDTGGALRWWVLPSSTGTPLVFDWGTSADNGIVCSDVDGDGTADATIWRSSTATFWSRLSGGGIRVQPWGTVGDDSLVVGDYDGDGQADPAVFRPTTGTYWVLQSSAGLSIQRWGQNGDFAQVMPDYDGDGKTDIAVQRGSLFWTKESTGAVKIVNWGVATDITNSGDFDGDGKSDLAVVRGVGGTMRWWIRSSESQAALSFYGSGFGWGLSATDSAASADYDGDGHTDLAVFRAGVFWIFNPASGDASARAWGIPGDYAVMNSFWK